MKLCSEYANDKRLELTRTNQLTPENVRDLTDMKSCTVPATLFWDEIYDLKGSSR
jgi:hypothetical protein